MIAAVLQGPKNIEVRQCEKPVPKPHEVLIRLQSIGICGSDVHLYLGDRLLPEPNIIGHEGIGIIEQIGEQVTNLQVGQRVALEPNVPCGDCRFCNNGKAKICPNKQVVGVNSAGCFSEYFAFDAAYCWPIPDSISDDDAVCIEPLAVVVHALKCTSAKPGASIAIFGLGAIGLLLTQLAIAKGYKVFAKDLVKDKEDFAVRLGAKLLPSEGLADFLFQNEIETVYDCVGATKATNMILETAPRGSEVILVGLATEPTTFVPIRIAREGISILPSIIYDHPEDFRETIRLIESKTILPSNIISGRYPLENFQEAIELAASGKATKLIIDINQ
ncbi:MAG: alcohol dehydrogenase [Bacteroidota bacterium]